MRSSIHWKRGRRKVKSRMSSLHFTRVSILPMCPLPAANPVRRIFTTPSPKCHTQGRGLSRWVYVKSTRHDPYHTPLSNLFPYRSQLVESFCLLEALANTAFFFGIPQEIALKSFWL
jgi:hypothetical protein